MTELKTLKDIELQGSTMSIANNYEKIKQKAIKWIELLETDEGDDYYSDPYCCKPTLIGWIKHFFNITEEECKGEHK